MSVKILSENLKKSEFLPLYYIYGEEEYLKQHYYNELKNKCVKDMPEFNFTEFNPKTFDFLDFTNCVNSYPVMAERKMVSVVDMDNALLKKDFTSELVDFLKTIPDYCTVVFIDTVTKTGTATALVKAVKSAGGLCVEVAHPDSATLVSWVKRQFKKYGKTIENSDLQYLIEIADSDMLSLENEIKKVCNYAKDSVVTRTDIDSVVTKSIEANRYGIADAFVTGDYTKVFDIVDKLYKQNVDDIAIANLFYYTFLDLWKGSVSLRKGKTSAETASELGMNPYGATKAQKNARRFDIDFLRRAVSLSLKLDVDLKSKPYNKRDLIVTYVASLVNEKQNYGKA